MTTTGLTSSLSSSLASSTTTSNTSSASTNTSSSAYSLSPEDFINLMVTQLKNQDPLSPASDSELLSQMSNIGQLETSTSLQSTMASTTLQSSIGSASSLIGKSITGINTANSTVTGVVQSVSVSGSDVTLNLDSGDGVKMSNVSSIAPVTTSADGTTTTGTATTGTTTTGTTTTGTTTTGT